MKGFLTLLVLVAISAGVFALGSFRKEKDGESILHVAEEVALTVAVEKPDLGGITRIVQAPGDVEAVLEVEISSEIVSKIVEMPIEEGDQVRAGDMLCRLDDKNLLADVESGEARISQLKAALVQAEADVEKAQRDMERQAGLSEAQATSDLELRDYVTVSKKARAVLEMRHHELRQAEAYLKRLHEELKKTVINSPIDGVVSKLNAKQGEVVVTGTMNNAGTVIMSISDLSKMQVRARVDEVDIPLLGSGQKGRVYLQADPNIPVPARVIRVASKGSRTIGRDVVTFEALLEVLSNDPRIRPGMTCNVEIEVDQCDEAVKLPVEAVVHRMRKDLPESVVKTFDEKQVGLDLSQRAKQGQYIKVVYVIEDDIAKVRLIDPGIADARQVQIREGVEMGDVVIVGPYRSLDQLKDGKKVAISNKDKDKQDSTPTETEGDAQDEKLASDNQDQPDNDKDDEKGDEKDTLASSDSP